MPLISKVEGKSARGRLLHAAIFLVLTLGGATMVYPFLLMISGALRSEMDEADLDLVPGFLGDDAQLYRKFLETKYNHDVSQLNAGHRRGSFSFRAAQLPAPASSAAADLERFLREEPPPRHWQMLGALGAQNLAGQNLWRLRDRLEARYGGDLAAFSRDTGIPAENWSTLPAPPATWLGPDFDFQDSATYQEYFALLDAAPRPERQLVSITQHFLESLVFPAYGRGGVQAFAAVVPELRLSSYDDFVLPRSVPPPDQPKRRELWVQFVQREVNGSFVLLGGVPAAVYRAFLRDRHGTIDALNAAWRTQHASFDVIDLPRGRWLPLPERRDYMEFVRGQPIETYRLIGPEYAWRDWLMQTSGSLDALNRAHSAAYPDFEHAPVPMDALEQGYVLDHAAALRWDYATRNFRTVFRVLFARGGALVNTLILCAATVGLTLLVNPLAAYGMSRFRLPATYKLLLFLMVTMAFPPMVTAIPMFILMRQLDLLNTLAALILPFVANGYQIFLLKGFFDSLPRELYESASIDGCSEWRMFLTITMALSKPILAVVALGAFSLAYGMFLFPLIVCPKSDLWTINVWLYQWQQQAPASAVFASLLIASLPTLLVFVFAQGVIMRGIVVPVEK